MFSVRPPVHHLLAGVVHIKGPYIDWVGLSPFVVLAAGAIVVLLVGLLSAASARERVVPLLTILTLAAAMGFEIARFNHHALIIAGALQFDDLALVLDLIVSVSAIAGVMLSWRAEAPRESGHGEYHALLLFSVLGMAVLVSAQNLITLFIGIELLSIPLYVLCASETRRESSLESGLKYLVIGSVGSATLVYGLALIYGASGSTDFTGIAAAVSHRGILSDPLLLTGLALVIVGLAFKASVAPFHQWTPDVYEGAPTPVTAFMATATKAAAFGVFLRFFDVAVIGAYGSWAPLLAAVAAITIIVGNVGALGQSSLKRMLGYSGVAQAGYMLGGVVVGTQLGIAATVLYLALYLGMNLAAFAVIVAQEQAETSASVGGSGGRGSVSDSAAVGAPAGGSAGSGPAAGGDESPPAIGDDISGLAGLGRRQPWLAWPMTIAMLSLAGIPGTVGFIGKFQLIHALVDGGYTWLAIVLVVGSMISLGYYLRVVAMIWMRGAEQPAPAARGLLALAPIAGGSPEADGALSAARAVPHPEIAFVALLFAAASIFFGIFPSPLFQLAAHAGHAIGGIF
ncbi:MAG: NADH-quinone oxidoreductase subunit N [Solirubrobacteraceae bacterium]